jgi:HPt (histidine-containing phosphotransfer) domain-containing protein
MTDYKSIPIIDESQYDQLMLLDEGKFELMSELLGIWTTTASEVHEQVQKAIEVKDLKVIEKLAHKMKGSCSNIAFSRLSNIWSLIETAAKEGSFETVSDTFESAKEYYKESKLSMEKRTAKTAA